jgi:dipeptidyl aminopeptidase/acylaminoacyl peptidase
MRKLIVRNIISIDGFFSSKPPIESAYRGCPPRRLGRGSAGAPCGGARWMRVALVLGLVALPVAAQASRPMVVEDLFTLSELADVSLSPGGDEIAATITRPGNANGCPTCNYKQSGDVWLIDRRTGERRNLTNGAADGGSSWLPTWSPDGRRLAFVSTKPEKKEPRGGNDIRLYLWDAEKGEITRLTARGVWLQVAGRAAGRPVAPIVWLDDSRLLVALLPPGTRADHEILYWRRAIFDARRAWERAEAGSESTASVLESGGAAAALPTVSLQAVDVASGKAVTLAELPKWDLWDLSIEMALEVSPNLSRAAVVAVTGTPRPRSGIPVTDDLRTYQAGIVALDRAAPVVWAELGREREHVEGRLHGWSADGQEVVVSEIADPSSRDRRRAAFAVSAVDGTRKETAADPRTAESRPATSRPSRSVFPSASARWVAGDAKADVLVFTDETSEGTILWVTDGLGRGARKLLTLNEHVRSISEGRRMLVSYVSADGAPLQGLAILPPTYEEGKRHPVVTWVYAGLSVREATTALAGKTSTRPLNLELLAGHGYVVLIPSVPLRAPSGARSEPLLAIPKGVLPCVDELVRLGVADPERLAVMGHSTGGYTTYALLTATNRFKAAVALSGHPDLVSLWGQFYPGERYRDRANEGLAPLAFVENVPLGLGGPPWEDPERYVRNSPLFHFDRVTTPLMIVHGDMDGAPIQQGEEAFTALWRQGKRARFVRYWGEGHVVASPANVRHLWGQMFEWLDSHLGGAPSRK